MLKNMNVVLIQGVVFITVNAVCIECPKNAS